MRRAARGARFAAMSASVATILFGGTSNERRDSVASAQNVAAVLDEAQALFLAPNGALFAVQRDELAGFERPFERDFVPAREAVVEDLIEAVESDPKRVYLLALHGGEGEDGSAQRILEARSIAFTGPGAEASSGAVDREIAKQVASGAGVRIAQSVHLSADPKVMRKTLRDMLAMHERVVAKPVAGGSSVGLYHLIAGEDIEGVAARIESSGDAYLAEQFVSGTELTVGVVDGPSGPRALPPSEVRLEPGRAFDFEGKYLGKGTREITPAEVAPEETPAAQHLALDAHRSLGRQGYSLTDQIVSARRPVLRSEKHTPKLQSP